MTYAEQKLEEAKKALILARDAEAPHVPRGVLDHAIRMVDACIAKADRNYKALVKQVQDRFQ